MTDETSQTRSDGGAATGSSTGSYLPDEVEEVPDDADISLPGPAPESVHEVEIAKGIPIVYFGEDGEMAADTVKEVRDGFVRVQRRLDGEEGDRWLSEADILAVGVYGDTPGVEVVFGGE